MIQRTKLVLPEEVKKKNPKGAGRKNRVSNLQIIKALKNTGGMKTHAAKQLGLTPGGLLYRLNKTPKLARVAREILEEKLDLAESELMKKIKEGHYHSIKFYLRCQGKERGFTEVSKLEHSGPDGAPFMIVVGSGYPGENKDAVHPNGEAGSSLETS
jgi:hypothetical protein